MKIYVKNIVSVFLLLFLLFCSQWAVAFSFHTDRSYQTPIVKFLGLFQGGPFSIVPFGTLPTAVASGGTTTAFYTITNLTSRTLPNCAVETIPRNTTLVTTGAGICGPTFTLAPQASCQVQLTISGAVNNLPPLFVCDQYGTSCSGNKDYPLNVHVVNVVSLSISPLNDSIPRGQSDQYTATATYSDGSTSDVTQQASWTSSKPNVASINSTGFATSQAIGATTITATLDGVSASTSLSVTSPTISSIRVSPTQAFLPTAQDQQYTATAIYSDGSTGDVTSSATWLSSSPSVASVDSAGLVSTHTAGETVISATLNGVKGLTPLTVVPAHITSITVSPSSASIALGLTQQFTATAIYSDGTSHDITSAATWSSSNTNVATVQTSPNANPGLATVGTSSSIVSQSADIRATYAGTSGAATLTAAAASLQSITLSPVSPHEPAGEVVHFQATGNYSNGSTADLTTTVTWSSDNTAAVAISNSLGTKGYATAVATGSANITALDTFTGIRASTPMTVVAAVLTSITVTPANASRSKGSTINYTATGTFSNGSTANITSSVTWVSTNPDIATITGAGVATVLASSGSTTIQAKAGSIIGVTQLTATPPTLTSIVVTPANYTLPKGETHQYTATGVYSDGSTQDITSSATWATLNSTVATISSSGLLTAGNPGTTTVRATVGSISGGTPFTATAAVVQSLAVTPVNPTVGQGLTQQFVATATYSDSTTAVVTAQTTWVSSNTAVATISNSSGTQGLATTLTQGSTTITGTYLGFSDHTTLTVGAPVPRSMSVTPTSITLPNGETQQMTANVTFSNGSILDETTHSTWTSGNTAIATVSSTGLVTAVASTGSTTIQASFTSGGVEVHNTASVTDTNAVVTGVTVAPATVNVPQNHSVSFTATATYSAGPSQNVTQSAAWTSGNLAVAKVISGGPQSGTATAVAAAGTANIKASYGGHDGTGVLTASGPSLVSIAVTPNPSTLLVGGGTGQFTATGTYSNGTTANITNTVNWTSSNTGVATIGLNTGTATPVAEGATTIQAADPTTSVKGAATLNVSSGDAFAAGQVTSPIPMQPLGYLGNSSGAQWLGNIFAISSEYDSGMLEAARYSSALSQYVSAGSAQSGSTTYGLIYPVQTNGVVNTPTLLSSPSAATTTGFGDITQSASKLITVGWYDDSGGQYHPAAFTSTPGGAWSPSTITTTGLEISNAFLNGVVCQTGSDLCVAVGQFVSVQSHLDEPLAYTSSDAGVSWSDSGVSIHGSLGGQANAVSWDGTNYEAVGYTNQPTLKGLSPIIYSSSTGQIWTAIPFIDITGALEDINCTTSYCVAVGYYIASGGNQAPLVFRNTGDGTPWIITRPAYTSGNSVLYGVSCSGTSCVAVGDTNNEATPVTYYSSDSGATWSGPTFPSAEGFNAGILYGIAYHP